MYFIKPPYDQHILCHYPDFMELCGTSVQRREFPLPASLFLSFFPAELMLHSLVFLVYPLDPVCVHAKCSSLSTPPREEEAPSVPGLPQTLAYVALRGEGGAGDYSSINMALLYGR